MSYLQNSPTVFDRYKEVNDAQKPVDFEQFLFLTTMLRSLTAVPTSRLVHTRDLCHTDPTDVSD